MLRPNLANDAANPTMKQIAKHIKWAVQEWDDPWMGFALVSSRSEPSSLMSYDCSEFQDSLWPTPNAPLSGAEVRSTEASAPLAGYMAAGVISLDCCFGLACSLTGCAQNS